MARRGPSGSRGGVRAGSLRVVAGRARGLRLATPEGTGTRPTSDRVREALFNALESLGAISGARVLDAYAGSGALGIEALSRGAEHATFAEVDRAALSVIEANLASTGLADRATVHRGDAHGLISSRAPGSWDLILLDPPYDHEPWDRLLRAAARALSPEGIVVIESDRDVPVPDDLGVLRSRSYSGTVVTFASPTTGDRP